MPDDRKQRSESASTRALTHLRSTGQLCANAAQALKELNLAGTTRIAHMFAAVGAVCTTANDEIHKELLEWHP